MRTRYLRYGLLTLILGSIVYLAMGRGQRSFEAFCPFGGVESLWGLLRAGEFTCALGPLNLSMFIAVLGLTLIAKKVFCGWGCPIGFLGELTGKLGGIVWPDCSTTFMTLGTTRVIRMITMTTPTTIMTIG